MACVDGKITEPLAPKKTYNIRLCSLWEKPIVSAGAGG